MKKLKSSILLFILSVNAVAQNYVVTNYNVINDSTILNTVAIQNLINIVEINGGGTIVFPSGTFLTGALFFKPKTKLLLMDGATIKGSDDINNYPLIPSRMEGRSIYYYAALINAYKVDSFSIDGPGTINGNGHKFWKYFWDYRDSVSKLGRSATNLEVHRPRLIFLWGCNNITIQNAQLKNAGFWTTHLYQCNNVIIKGCKITSPFKPVKAPSTDGIDLDVCNNVTIRNCFISVNDDAICIKGGKGPNAHLLNDNGIVENVLIENCDFGDSHGTLTLGSECIHAKNITMRNCTMNHNTSILRLKMRPDTYQIYENITIENITGKCGSIIAMAPWKQFFDMNGSDEKPFAIVKNIQFSNIDVQCKTIGTMEGNANDKISKISFSNITAIAETPTLKTNYKKIKLKNFKVNGTSFTLKK